MHIVLEDARQIYLSDEKRVYLIDRGSEKQVPMTSRLIKYFLSTFGKNIPAEILRTCFSTVQTICSCFIFGQIMLFFPREKRYPFRDGPVKCQRYNLISVSINEKSR